MYVYINKCMYYVTPASYPVTHLTDDLPRANRYRLSVLRTGQIYLLWSIGQR